MLCGIAAAADGLKSGPQVGDRIAPFHPLNVFNAEDPAAAGTRNCLV
jgi:hypothetical protein